MSTQLSLLPPADIAAPTGLEYHAEFITAAEERHLLAQFDDAEWLTDLSRRVLHFGYKYDYSNRKLDEAARIGPLPEWLVQLTHRIHNAASDDAQLLLDARLPFEQAIINEYRQGQGIAPHIDRDCFGPVVATLSMGSAINMDFCCSSTGDQHVMRLEARSLVLMHGDARSTWRHGIAKRKSDLWNGQKIERQRRVSITFRTIADVRPAQD